MKAVRGRRSQRAVGVFGTDLFAFRFALPLAGKNPTARAMTMKMAKSEVIFLSIGIIIAHLGLVLIRVYNNAESKGGCMLIYFSFINYMIAPVKKPRDIREKQRDYLKESQKHLKKVDGEEKKALVFA